MSRKAKKTKADKAREAAAVAEWRRKNPEKYARTILRYNLSKHGLTIEEYEAMVLAQNGVCAICHTAEISRQRLSVDHDHKTGKVRALLCIRCNCILGYAKDTPALLFAAAAYLKRYAS